MLDVRQACDYARSIQRTWGLIYLMYIVELFEKVDSPLVQKGHHISPDLGEAPQEEANLPGTS